MATQPDPADSPALSWGNGLLRPGVGAWATRSVWLVLAAASTAAIVVAAFLEPDPSGHGTHTQLGLPPCGFLLFTGYPCAGCGMTTAFAHAARLDFLSAVHANPFGLMLFFVTIVMVPWASLGAVQARPVMDTIDRFRIDRWALLLALSSLLTWGARALGQALG